MSTPNELSFLPDDYLERKAQRRTNAICAGLFMVVMGAIGSAFTITERAVRAVEIEHEAVEKQYTEAAKRIDLVQQLQDKQRRMAQQAELAASLLEKVPRSYVLAEITNALPPGVSLIDLSMESRPRAAAIPTPAAAKTAFEQKRAPGAKPDAEAFAPKQYDVGLHLTGVATNDVQVAQFIGKLSDSKILSDVNLVLTDEFKRGDETVRKFQLELKLDPNAEVDPAVVKPAIVATEIKPALEK